MNARDEILGRIRGAPIPPLAVDPEPDRGDLSPRPADVELFISRLADYGASPRRLGGEGEIRESIERILGSRGVSRLLVPDGVPAAWLPVDGATITADGPSLGAVEVSEFDACLTTCTAAIAETGTIVLGGGPGQGRRLVTLLPDIHICVVSAYKVVACLAEAILGLPDRRAPLTFVSGPSATADIEFERVAGVHGPRTLDVLVVGDGISTE